MNKPVSFVEVDENVSVLSVVGPLLVPVVKVVVASVIGSKNTKKQCSADHDKLHLAFFIDIR